MGVRALHHLVEESLVELYPLFGGHHLIMGTAVQVARAGASGTADASRVVGPFATF
jgi:hypothetical protein